MREEAAFKLLYTHHPTERQTKHLQKNDTCCNNAFAHKARDTHHRLPGLARQLAFQARLRLGRPGQDLSNGSGMACMGWWPGMPCLPASSSAWEAGPGVGQDWTGTGGPYLLIIAVVTWHSMGGTGRLTGRQGQADILLPLFTATHLPPHSWEGQPCLAFLCFGREGGSGTCLRSHLWLALWLGQAKISPAHTSHSISISPVSTPPLFPSHTCHLQPPPACLPAFHGHSPLYLTTWQAYASPGFCMPICLLPTTLPVCLPACLSHGSTCMPATFLPHHAFYLASFLLSRAWCLCSLLPYMHTPPTC